MMTIDAQIEWVEKLRRARNREVTVRRTVEKLMVELAEALADREQLTVEYLALTDA